VSLILEALRKSESERQGARLPGLMTPAPVTRPRGTRWLPWLLLPLTLALGLGAGWLYRERAVPSPLITDSAPAAPGAETPPPAPVSLAPPPPAGDSRPAALPAPPAVAPDPRIAETVAAPDATPAAAASDSAPIALPPATPDPVAPGQPAAEPTAAVADHVLLDLMPPSQRAGLPDLKLSVHVFSEEASRRFAVIDGRRVQEGDSLRGDLHVREIRREGVLLDVAGQPWLLPRPR